ncbi:MAG: glycosyltransferase family 2 protein [Anaerolineaceae bacterium]
MKTSIRKISVIIPSYNCSDFITEALDSVFSQTYPLHEVIVVDDGSTDKTDEVIKKYSDRISYIKQDNGGPAKARNTALKLATGEFLTFLDADDIWTPNKTETQIRVFLSKPNIGLVYSRFVDFNNESGDDVQVRPSTLYSGMILNKLLTANLVGWPTVMVRKSVLDKVGYFHESLLTGEDTNLLIRIAREHEIYGLDEVLLRRRLHTNNLSNRCDIRVGTLAALDDFFGVSCDLSAPLHPCASKAYQLRGTAMVLENFNNRQYDRCHSICRDLIRRRVLNKMIIFCWLVTFLPPSVLDVLRNLRRSFFKPLTF